MSFKEWGFFEWLAYGVMFVGAIILAADTALKSSSDQIRMPFKRLLEARFWGFAPLLCLMIGILVLGGRGLGWLGALPDAHSPYAVAAEFSDKKLTQIVGRSYKNQTVHLDGYEFLDCTFENVTFVYEGVAPFLLTEAHFPEHTLVQFGSPNPMINVAVGMMVRLTATGGRIGYRFISAEEVKGLSH